MSLTIERRGEKDKQTDGKKRAHTGTQRKKATIKKKLTTQKEMCESSS